MLNSKNIALVFGVSGGIGSSIFSQLESKNFKVYGFSRTINNNVINYHNYILSNIDKIKSLGIKNCVPSYNKILIQFDPFLKNKSKILKYLNSIKIKDINDIKNNKIIKIPICYDEKYAIDLR